MFQNSGSGNSVGVVNAALRGQSEITNAALSNAPNQSDLILTAKRARGLTNAARRKANNEASTKALGNKLINEKIQMQKDLDKKVDKLYEPANRMAGVLTGVRGLASTHMLITENNRQKKQQEVLKNLRTERDALATELRGAADKRSQEFLETMQGQIDKLEESINSPNTSGTNTTTTTTTTDSSTSTLDGTTTKIGAGDYDLDSLTDQDWSDISRGVSGEAGPGKDRFAVAASMLNRVSSDKFPNTVKGVVYQNDGKGTYQYDALTKKIDRDDPDLLASLKSPEGKAEILKALSVLDGRTDFKGQALLSNRSNKGNKDYDGDGVPDLDPMFDPKGNYYHYAGQT
tara:strand:- start:183 stop:1217 length:1035 start_codon:yes stop_codon:yes gene_type:complete